MTDLINQIRILNDIPDITKHEKIIEGICNSIEASYLNKGDSIPSINQLSSELGFARETIVKAYNELKDRGIVQSKRGLGYFVTNDDVKAKMNIALVMYGFQTFQQTFYNTLRKSLCANYKIDVYFHHNNLDVYKSILENIRMKYGVYIVAPIQKEDGEIFLKSIPPKKLLIVDRYQYLGDHIAHITQDFEASLNSIFNELTMRFKRFKKVVFFFKEDSDYPIGIRDTFRAYCRRENIILEAHEEYDINLLEKNVAYFTVGDGDLWNLIKDAKDAGYSFGKDIGILSHNDSPVKSFIVGGITTFSTDFELMAKKAAKYIEARVLVKEIVPIELILRNTI